MTAPSKDCQDRHTACHDKCPKYQEYRAERIAIREKRMMELHVNGILNQRQTGMQREWIMKRKRLGK